MAEPTPTPTPAPAPAPEPTPTPEPTPAPAPEPTPTPEPPAKSYSQDDLDAAVKKAVAETKAEMEKQAKLAKLPEDEKRQEELRLKEEDYEKRNAELNRRELMQDATDMLSEKGIPVSFAKHLLGADKKETKVNVDAFAKEWSDNISASVDEKLKGGKPPKAGGGDPVDPFLEGLGV